MSLYRNSIGKIGEDAACEYLQSRGYLILERNFRSKFGEIDIVTRYKDKYIFVEVKTKTDDRTGKPFEAVGRNKINHIKRAVEFYLLSNKIKNVKLSIDVVSIMLDQSRKIKQLQHFQSVEI